MRTASRCVLFGFLGVALGGCMDAAQGDKNVKYLPVSGVVKYKGAPLGGASLNFQHADGIGGIGLAMSDDNGKFTVKTGSQSGCAAGKVKVSVTVSTGEAGNAASNNPMGGTVMSLDDLRKRKDQEASNPGAAEAERKKQEEAVKKAAAAGSSAPTDTKAKSLIPAKYSKLVDTPLFIEVSADKTEYEINIPD